MTLKQYEELKNKHRDIKKSNNNIIHDAKTSLSKLKEDIKIQESTNKGEEIIAEAKYNISQKYARSGKAFKKSVTKISEYNTELVEALYKQYLSQRDTTQTRLDNYDALQIIDLEKHTKLFSYVSTIAAFLTVGSIAGSIITGNSDLLLGILPALGVLNAFGIYGNIKFNANPKTTAYRKRRLMRKIANKQNSANAAKYILSRRVKHNSAENVPSPQPEQNFAEQSTK